MRFNKHLLASAELEIARLTAEKERIEKELKTQYHIKDFMELLKEKEGKRPKGEEE